MRTSILLLVGLAAALAVASPALADITVNHLPVHACAAGVCTPCLDPVTVPVPVVNGRIDGADC